MKKPLHGFACVLWVTAFLYPVSEILRQLMLPTGGNAITYWVLARGVVIGSITIAALAILIEIADQIRWRLLTPEEQSQRLSGPSPRRVAKGSSPAITD